MTADLMDGRPPLPPITFGRPRPDPEGLYAGYELIAPLRAKLALLALGRVMDRGRT